MSGKIIKLLDQLIDRGSVAGSSLSPRSRRRLEPLFDTGVLSETRNSRGSRIILNDKEALSLWVEETFPSGPEGPSIKMPQRAHAVAQYRCSKSGSRLASTLVHLRGFTEASLRRGSDVLPLADLTKTLGVASFLLDSAPSWIIQGNVVVVENFEVFLHIEEIIQDIDVAIWSKGRLAERVVDWLASLSDIRILHAGDYDATGLDEYSRLAAALPGQVELFVPHDFERILAQFGKRDLLLKPKSTAVLGRLRSTASGTLKTVIDLMDRNGKALEQEALLIPHDLIRAT